MLMFHPDKTSGFSDEVTKVIVKAREAVTAAKNKAMTAGTDKPNPVKNLTARATKFYAPPDASRKFNGGHKWKVELWWKMPLVAEMDFGRTAILFFEFLNDF